MNSLSAFKNIKGFIFDVDGVFTNTAISLMENGDQVRQFTVRDHYAVRRALKLGYKICVITAGRSEGVDKNLRNLGIEYIYGNTSDKKPAFIDFLIKSKLEESQVLYMGDDIPDLPVMRLVALPACPSDAVPEILEIAKYVSPLKGGEGCVRDVIEIVLKLNQQWVAV